MLPESETGIDTSELGKCICKPAESYHTVFESLIGPFHLPTIDSMCIDNPQGLVSKVMQGFMQGRETRTWFASERITAKYHSHKPKSQGIHCSTARAFAWT